MRHAGFLVWMGCFWLLAVADPYVGAPHKPVPEQPDLCPYLLTTPRELFTVRWGAGPGELRAPIEPGGDWYGTLQPHIAADGSVYVGLRQFDRRGRFLGSVKSPDRSDLPETMDHFVRYYVVDPQGRLVEYSVSQRKEFLRLYGRDGKPVKDADARLQHALQQALTLRTDNTKPFRLGMGLKCLPDGRVIVGDGYRVDLTTGAVDWVPEESSVPLINLHRGHLYRVEKAEPGVRSEKWYVYKTGQVLYTDVDWWEGGRYRVSVYDDKGRLQRQLLLPSGDRSEVEKLLPFDTPVHAVDGRGHFYVVCFPRVVYDVPLFEQDYQRYLGVLEYDREGRLVGLRAVCEVFSYMNITVDKDGNVYWLQPGKDGVKVMMAPVPQGTR